MNTGILGTKLGMAQLFDSAGLAIPVTIIKAGPCTVTQVKSLEKEGYYALQLGYMETQASRVSKPILGHLKKTGSLPLKYLKEYKTKTLPPNNVGSTVSVAIFGIGDMVSVSGKTIGKGFAGTVKRHNFTRGPMTHGSKNHREPGSIGMGTTPGRVYPGKKMAGRLGGKQSTIKNLSVILIDSEDNLLVVKGSVPGKPGTILSIKKTTR
jgi:large subunit ribosomal protein L3|uniref:ribosomal protein L3 n=1 Tax=Cryptomonas gyropyrenoidosa TaxID=233257 RepID=UPI0027A33103|nr:ribosomal protein L3 [Cryptomonas gyropyrenoidosa]WFQ82999.1 ribosomal protein L3 [Cryptomonas gyropyrenoidosa]